MLSREMCKMLIFLFFIKMTLNESIVSSTRIVCWFKVMAFILWFYVVFVLRFCKNRPVVFFHYPNFSRENPPGKQFTNEILKYFLS